MNFFYFHRSCAKIWFWIEFISQINAGKGKGKAEYENIGEHHCLSLMANYWGLVHSSQNRVALIEKSPLRWCDIDNINSSMEKLSIKYKYWQIKDPWLRLGSSLKIIFWSLSIFRIYSLDVLDVTVSTSKKYILLWTRSYIKYT